MVYSFIPTYKWVRIQILDFVPAYKCIGTCMIKKYLYPLYWTGIGTTLLIPLLQDGEILNILLPSESMFINKFYLFFQSLHSDQDENDRDGIKRTCYHGGKGFCASFCLSLLVCNCHQLLSLISVFIMYVYLRCDFELRRDSY